MAEYTVRVHYDRKVVSLKASAGTNLLSLFQTNGITLAAPCAGNGTCKKCTIHSHTQTHNHTPTLKNLSLACQTNIESDLDITLPTAPSALIQSESYYPDLPIVFDTHSKSAFGIAVDIGTTTVVVYLENLKTHVNQGVASFINPQQSFGADVISRISYATEANQLTDLQQSLVAQINQAVEALCKTHGVPISQLNRMNLTGNTTMLHLLKGVDPSPLAQYPFIPVFLDTQKLSAGELGFHLLPDAQLMLLQGLSAFVGADILAGLAATEIPDEDPYSLFLDIGTNGEMALGNRHHIHTCATAAGPAFEGARISCGLGGVAGAIHSFDSNGYQTIDQQAPAGVCGSGLIDVVAFLLKSKQLDPSGYTEKPLAFTESLSLTPQDIREVQLAKAAIAAGIQTLIKRAAINENEIAKVYLAGGFGHAINPQSAADIGLLPSALVSKVIRAGNTAGLGARLSLHASAFIDRLQMVKEKSAYFELSSDMDFNEAFVMNMNF